MNFNGERNMEAITFVNRHQVSIVSSKEELLREINHYQAFWLSSLGDEYSNNKNAVIKVSGLTPEIRTWLSLRMR